MEEAYMELYQEFLRLRSLCLRQAALLQQLTKALQKQQGTFVANGELGDMVSIPVQCTQEPPLRLHEEPEPLTATTQGATAQRGIDRPPRGVGTFSHLLAEDLGKLCVDVPHQRKEDGKAEHKAPPFSAPKSPGWHGASSWVSKTPRQAGHSVGDRALQTSRMPAAASPFLDSEFLNQMGGMLMSDLALQSHVCEFCQAVFPGDTTTSGEFLRHLHTHIT
ncbi:uncharacterized protein [Centroberyx affinis]|uniref:uncharacterized protein isoform X2 n=1 Tax=Centroberyx affinis TaxID=166261 RepID=UPI003A5B97D5